MKIKERKRRFSWCFQRTTRNSNKAADFIVRNTLLENSEFYFDVAIGTPLPQDLEEILIGDSERDQVCVIVLLLEACCVIMHFYSTTKKIVFFFRRQSNGNINSFFFHKKKITLLSCINLS